MRKKRGRLVAPRSTRPHNFVSPFAFYLIFTSTLDGALGAIHRLTDFAFIFLVDTEAIEDDDEQSASSSDNELPQQDVGRSAVVGAPGAQKSFVLVPERSRLFCRVVSPKEAPPGALTFYFIFLNHFLIQDAAPASLRTGAEPVPPAPQPTTSTAPKGKARSTRSSSKTSKTDKKGKEKVKRKRGEKVAPADYKESKRSGKHLPSVPINLQLTLLILLVHSSWGRVETAEAHHHHIQGPPIPPASGDDWFVPTLASAARALARIQRFAEDPCFPVRP